MVKGSFLFLLAVVAEEVDSMVKTSRAFQTGQAAAGWLANTSSKQQHGNDSAKAQQLQHRGSPSVQQQKSVSEQQQQQQQQEELESQQPKQRRCLMWPGLHKRRCLQHMTTSSGSAATYSNAYSCPSSLVAAAGRLRANEQPSSAAAAIGAAAVAPDIASGSLPSPDAISAAAALADGKGRGRDASAASRLAAARGSIAGDTAAAAGSGSCNQQTNPVSDPPGGSSVPVAAAEASAPSSNSNSNSSSSKRAVCDGEREPMDWRLAGLKQQQPQRTYHHQVTAEGHMEQRGSIQLPTLDAGAAAGSCPSLLMAVEAPLLAAAESSGSLSVPNITAAAAAVLSQPPSQEAPAVAPRAANGDHLIAREGQTPEASAGGGPGTSSRSSSQRRGPLPEADATGGCSRQQGLDIHGSNGIALQPGSGGSRGTSGHGKGSGSRESRPGGSGSRLQICSKRQRVPLANKERPVKALVGVRMVWVSQEHRRKGIATKLLDAAR